MHKDLKVAGTIRLGAGEVALVWDSNCGLTACVSDAGLAEAMPLQVAQAFAVMLSLDDPEIAGAMWDRLEKRMDEEAVKDTGLRAEHAAEARRDLEAKAG